MPKACTDPNHTVQAEAVEILLSQMVRYPAGTKFFLNAWTWGYEVSRRTKPVDGMQA